MQFLYLTLCFVASILITPLVKKLAINFKITDAPNHRKIHNKIMPRLGGLAIYISFMIGLLVSHQHDPHLWAIMVGSLIIVITGILDDIFELSARYKLLGQLFAATVAILGGFELEFINLPFGGELQFGFLSVPLTILWIVGITNAINLIDGLDGLAAGVSSIALITLSIMAFIMGDAFVVTISLILLGSTLGFLLYNFHPAKIFMGDTGALFLGYMIAILSLLGFKNVTFFSLVIPVIILGVPISDTIFAIIRRIINNQPLSAADQHHLHHRLLSSGFSHRQAVVIIYAVAVMFGLTAVIFSMATIWGSLLIVAVLLVAIELFVEAVGLVGKDYKPLLRFMRR
ncbi:glycosyltransferase family 4 protein [Lederbergia citrea]|uniref:Undecaprenyl/decaprenyl-phosphate alpha-N-acetylglucosaminyl 1-phosphate transferase n=1 Tax=Lederbergia citrea TaxID=2833581 RepID=A0A942UQW1_9BACI|nr:MraY family glycosyltransferase [Lederbergia citrea]MBS4223391.1 undecaprenyl/decaprenyl-phosphate alpha-N-acetylglucosaminyl 1-phosphate transferase [Lederbergia citrea]